MQQLLDSRDRLNYFDFKNPRHNETSCRRNEEIRQKYNLQKRAHQRR